MFIHTRSQPIRRERTRAQFYRMYENSHKSWKNFQPTLVHMIYGTGGLILFSDILVIFNQVKRMHISLLFSCIFVAEFPLIEIKYRQLFHRLAISDGQLQLFEVMTKLSSCLACRLTTILCISNATFLIVPMTL